MIIEVRVEIAVRYTSAPVLGALRNDVPNPECSRFWLSNGLLTLDSASKTLRIHYDKYHDVVGKMLAKTLDVQYQGDKVAADRFIDQYTTWDENLHGAIAKNIRDQQRYRFRLFKYAALGE